MQLWRVIKTDLWIFKKYNFIYKTRVKYMVFRTHEALSPTDPESVCHLEKPLHSANFKGISDPRQNITLSHQHMARYMFLVTPHGLSDQN